MKTLEKERSDGVAARQVLDSDVFQQAWGAAEDSIFQQMVEVSLRDTEMHTKLIMALQVLGNVRKYINTQVETGEMANLQLNEESKITRMFRR